MAPATATHTLQVDGYPLAFVETGAGAPPLLLVHGSLCDCRYWAPQMAPLGAGRRVLAPSLRHYWPEAWDGSGGDFTPARHADDLAVFVRALRTGPVHLLGHSRGGAVACLTALRRPELVRSLILAEPGLTPDEGDCSAAIDIDRAGFRKRALEHIRQDDTDAGLALFVDTVSGAGTWSRMLPALRQMMRDNAATLIGQAVEAAVCLNRHQAASLRMPVLLLGGAQSPQPYPAVLETLAQWLPRVQRVTVSNASHALNLWNPAGFNRAVEDFLGEH
ncbi:MAG: alpha/beta hydrolase [Nevskia sp.]|nr:alpha/beta hydrolase [Nevskia sp.]